MGIVTNIGQMRMKNGLCGLFGAGGEENLQNCRFLLLFFSNLYPIFVPYTKNTRYNMPNETINRIKVVLAEQNKTNKWLAGELGITQATVSRWGRNRTQPSLEKLVEIARLLNVEVKDLINKESEIKQFREDEE